jgi:hypothetical protein
MVANYFHRNGESVRVVEESESSDRRHRWDRDGERCLKCNDKDWMGGPCNTTDEDYIEKLTDERDAAIRERDTLRAERITQALTADRFASAVAEADRLRAHVVELEQQAATLQKAVKEGVVEIERAMADSRGWRDKLRRQLPPTMQNCTIVFKECEFGHHWLTATNWAGHSCPWCEHDTLRAQLAKMKAAPAASGAAGTGWLTAEERRLIGGMMESASAFPPTMQWHSGLLVRDTLRVMEALLARSSPPEVERPPYKAGHSMRDGEWIAALAAAGVPCKEVGQ